MAVTAGSPVEGEGPVTGALPSALQDANPGTLVWGVVVLSGILTMAPDTCSRLGLDSCLAPCGPQCRGLRSLQIHYL